MSNRLLCAYARRYAYGMMLLASLAVAACSEVKPPPTGDGALEKLTELSDADLQRQIDEALDYTVHERRLNTRDHCAWQVVHGAMAFGSDFLIEHDGRDVSALDYLLGGGRLKGWDFDAGDILDEKTGRRGLRAQLQSGSSEGQGHADQWLGYLSMQGFPPTQTIKVGSDTYTMRDYLMQAQFDVPRNPNREYSWSVMSFSAYFPTSAEWVASDGKTWSLDQLMTIEAEQDIYSSACGGTHRLTGMTMALHHHLEQGGKLTGGWEKAHQKIEECIERAKRFQNADGSFSSNYVERAGSVPAADRTLNTSGHVFEFLTVALPESRLQEPWMKKAAFNLCALIRKTRGLKLECGGLYHAAHGLVVYRERMFGKRSYAAPPATSTPVAAK